MATSDIKDLDVFNTQRGINKVKEFHSNKNHAGNNQNNKSSNITLDNSNNSLKKPGAPIRKFDRVYATKAPLKLSTLLNSISRNLVEKYETELTRDELLRKALDQYVKQNLPLEDKKELYNTVLKDLDLFREKFPTIPEKDSNNNIIRTPEEIEQQTALDLKENWGINNRI